MKCLAADVFIQNRYKNGHTGHARMINWEVFLVDRYIYNVISVSGAGNIVSHHLIILQVCTKNILHCSM